MENIVQFMKTQKYEDNGKHGEMSRKILNPGGTNKFALTVFQ